MAKKYGYVAPISDNPPTPDTEKSRQNAGWWLAEYLEKTANSKKNFKVIWLNRIGNIFEAFYEWEE
jgi:hypothetical protein